MTREQHTINSCPEPMRFDRYLRLKYNGMTQGLIEKLLRKGLIRLNSKKVEAKERVIDGDIVELRIQFLEDEVKEKSQVYGSKSLADKLFEEYLIAETDNFIVINKPAGLSSQSGTNVRIAIDDALNYLNSNISEGDNINQGFRLVHRLDKETSGLFLIAKNRTSAAKLTKAFKDKEIEKQYIAIVSGHPKRKSGKITSYLIKDGYLKIQKSAAEGDYAETDYEVIVSNDQYSQILFTPKTGRMHQLRVHAKELGCPILGDSKYGYADKEKKLMLHAYKLKIPSSLFGEEYEFYASLPNYFSSYTKFQN